MIISLDKYKNKGSGGGSGGGKFVVGDTTKFPTSTWSSIPDNLDFSQTTDFTSMFQQCSNLTEGLRLGDWSKVTTCAGMYYNCPSLTWAEDMVNSYNCVYFIRMFTGTQLISAPYIDTQNAASVAFMFNGCSNLQEINVSSTANITTADDFNQFCYNCPNLTTINGLDFSGISMATAEPIAVFGEGSGALGPVIFGNNNSLTDITISGSISFSWNHQYGPSALTNLSNKSIISFLTAMSNCNNPEEPKTMTFNCKYEYGSEVPQLIEDCTNKNWSISGLTLGVPYVIIDNVPTDVEIGKDFEINYHVTSETERFFGLTSTILRVYDDYGYSKDFELDSLSGVIMLNDSDLQDARFKTIVIYNDSSIEGGEYSYNRVDNGGSEPEIDTLWGNPDEAIPVSFAEFATKPPVSEMTLGGSYMVLDAQWYELTGILTAAPQLETGTWILTDPDGVLEQSFTVDGNEYKNAIVVNHISPTWTKEINNDWNFENFPGDGSLVTIRTLKHRGIPSNVNVNVNNGYIDYAGKNGNSPLAIFVGSEGAVETADVKFWVDGEVNPGEEFDLNYELYNRKDLTEDPYVEIFDSNGNVSISLYEIKDDNGKITITDNAESDPFIMVYVNGVSYVTIEYTRVGDDIESVTPDIKFWIDGDVNAGQEFNLNHELYNREELTRDPHVEIHDSNDNYIISYYIQVDNGKMTITDNAESDQFIMVYVNDVWYMNIEYTRVSEGGDTKPVMPAMAFWVDGEVSSGEAFALNYLVSNRKDLTEDPVVDLFYGKQEELVGGWTIKDDEGVLSITDNTKYEPLIEVYVNGEWYTNVEYIRVSGDDTQAVELNVTSHSCTDAAEGYRDITFNCEDGKSIAISFTANPIVEGTYTFDDKTLGRDFCYYDNVNMTECTAIVTGAVFPGALNIDVTFKRQDDDTTYHFTYQGNLNE